MEDLLQLVDDELTINPHFLSIDVINTIWKRDHGISRTNPITKKNERVKVVGRRELSWIWYMENWRSPYNRYTDRNKREVVVKNRLGLAEDWKEDKALKEAREWYYNEQIETNDKLADLESARKANGAIRNFLDVVNLTDSSNIARTGTAIYKPKDISAAIKELAVTQKSIDDLESAVKANKNTNRKVRGEGKVGRYEDA